MLFVLFVLPEVFTLVLGPSFDLPCLLATAIFDSFSLFYLPNTYMTTVKTIALTRRTFVAKVMSLLFNKVPLATSKTSVFPQPLFLLLTLTHFIHSLHRCVPGVVLSAEEQNSLCLHEAHGVVEEIETDQVAIQV